MPAQLLQIFGYPATTSPTQYFYRESKRLEEACMTLTNVIYPLLDAADGRDIEGNDTCHYQTTCVKAKELKRHLNGFSGNHNLMYLKDIESLLKEDLKLEVRVAEGASEDTNEAARKVVEEMQKVANYLYEQTKTSASRDGVHLMSKLKIKMTDEDGGELKTSWSEDILK